MKKLKVNEEACISCGACVGMYPDLFTFENGDTADVKVDVVPENMEDDAIEAMEGCPTGAISYKEEEN